ncbi:MAG: nuclease-related domain-containing protein [Thermovenabulum sp.]|uniref:nuclease-related domain-containing protein n=1 Tax=Thermovenabulum sp. TaxID=3100335 RepID=UPI003C7CB183
MNERIDEKVPKWISWAIKPIANLNYNIKQSRNSDKGEGGEFGASLSFLLMLPNNWRVANDIVIEAEVDEFAQINHIIIGPPGIFLVETKAWEGAYIGYNDRWKRKEGDRWVPCKSPTEQNKYHKEVFAKWLKGQNLGITIIPEDIITPIVLMAKCKWLKVKDCSMPVFESGLGLSLYLRNMTKKGEKLTDEQIEAIARAIEKAEPIAMRYNIENIEVKRTREGKEYIRIKGGKEKAEEIRRLYGLMGEKISEVYKDKFTDGWWYFTKIQ